MVGQSITLSQTNLSGTFHVINGNATVNTTSDLMGIVQISDLVIFASQPGVPYTVLSVASSSITLTGNYTGTTTTATTAVDTTRLVGVNDGTYVITEVTSSSSCVIYAPGFTLPETAVSINWNITWHIDDGWYPIVNVNWTGTIPSPPGPYMVAEYTASATQGTIYGMVVSAPIGDPLNRLELSPYPATVVPTTYAKSPRPMLLAPGESTLTTNQGFSYDRLYSFIYNDVDDEYALLYFNYTTSNLVFQKWKKGLDQPAPEVIVAASVPNCYCADMAFNGREYCVSYGDSTSNAEALHYVLLSATGVISSSGIVDNGTGAGGVVGNSLPNQIPGMLFGSYSSAAVQVNLRNVQIRWNNRMSRWVIAASYRWYTEHPLTGGNAELVPSYPLFHTQVTSQNINQITLNVNTDLEYFQPGMKLLVVDSNTAGGGSNFPRGVYTIMSVTSGANPVITLDTGNLPILSGSAYQIDLSIPAYPLSVLPREDVICYTLGYTTPAVEFSDADECFLDNVSIGGALDITEKYSRMATPIWQAASPTVGQPSRFNSVFTNEGFLASINYATAFVPNAQRQAQYNHLLLKPTRVRAPVYTNIRSSTKARYGYGLAPTTRGAIVFRKG
jgi:hypothetical protein